MNQQTLAAVHHAYPAQIADNLARLNEVSAFQHAREISDGESMCTEAAMARNLEKILSITRLSWAAAHADKQLPVKIRR